MTKRFIISIDDFKKRNLILSILMLIWIFFALIKFQYDLLGIQFFSIITLSLIAVLVLVLNFVQTYHEIGEFVISPKKIQFEIHGNSQTIVLNKENYKSITFYYKGFKGDQSASVLGGTGILNFYNGAGNTFEILTSNANYKFDIKINNRMEYKALKMIFNKMEELGQNIIISNK